MRVFFFIVNLFGLSKFLWTVTGFGGWHMGNQSQDEVFLAAQEAVGAHRDSQGKIFVLITRTCPSG